LKVELYIKEGEIKSLMTLRENPKKRKENLRRIDIILREECLKTPLKLVQLQKTT